MDSDISQHHHFIPVSPCLILPTKISAYQTLGAGFNDCLLESKTRLNMYHLEESIFKNYHFHGFRNLFRSIFSLFLPGIWNSKTVLPLDGIRTSLTILSLGFFSSYALKINFLFNHPILRHTQRLFLSYMVRGISKFILKENLVKSNLGDFPSLLELT